MKKNMKIFINIILIIIILICAFKIGYKYLEYYRDGKNYSKVQILKPNIQQNVKEDSNEEKLKQINSDYKFWINIPSSDINYPVVQGKDNKFYLHNNFYREKSASGTVFIDYKNNINSDKNIIIYGHNMKNGTMFNKINDFKKQENFNNGTIKITKDNKDYNYEIFSVFVEDGDYTGLRTNFNSNEDYKKYIDYLKEKSMYNKDIKGNNYNNIITLYTCSYEFKDARTIVCAMLK
ncbi:sortase B [Clostridium pasteurianum DSM 525 = ATCC 6013]|uniref:Sortase B n=1 Tax=Clostridium pasteurianum DSM 525 = ATCC 6013 TaxID=1262449 RepID=A0A0H3J538_CLOPA|nr:class B sortase [Clostridium pasteurianum]AJA48187.1 sortase B [Clostridium pasteurianum DSM 525 = ATCC 6013]AJA52175.1 sortase B [Clostridium pasteurianum DSM 525 = ATCC 6013]AOZ75446.1 sortase B [Clostridium pasteurianum DSM 525 = ATCC 6013]AOZ79241.1 sortase B [Clostridium pasteurianum]ELP60661.1 sortase B [Clostridium pasteurianum DSM 525 = ATCC 6013]